MSDTDTFDLYLVQDPFYVLRDNAKGQLYNLLSYYAFSFKFTLPVNTTVDLVQKVMGVARARGQKLKTLVIASHGAAGTFYIGKDLIDRDADVYLSTLGQIAPFLDKNAEVYIVACFTAREREVLQKVSLALGGVRVHGYTEWIWTHNYGVLVTMDDSVNSEGGGHEIVCLANKCSVAR
jgi:hypothetical protein